MIRPVIPLRRAAPWLVLVAATLLVYANSIGNGFVWDDDDIVVSNPMTRDLGQLGRVLLSPDQQPPYYRPLNRASYLVDYALFGMDPRAYHAVNVALHLACVLLLYALAVRLFEGRRLPALLAALLLAVHPLGAEAVDFVSARNNLFALGFSLASAALFADAVQRRSTAFAAASGVAFFLGLLSKEPAAMTLPLLAVWTVLPGPANPARERIAWRLRWLLPHVAATAVYVALRSISLGGPVSAPPAAQGLISRLAVNLWTIPTYLGLAAWPKDLTIFHADGPPASAAAIAMMVVAWAVVIAALWMQVRRPSPAGAFGWAWMALQMAPISNVVPFTSALVAERFVYMPSAGLWLVVADAVQRLVARGVPARAAAGVAACALAAFGLRTASRNTDWRDDVTLDRSATRVDGHSLVAWFNLGVSLRNVGDAAGARGAWEKALAIDPRDAGSLTQLGTLLASEGVYGRAEELLRRAIAASPSADVARFNLGLVLERTGRLDGALTEYDAVASGALGDPLSRTAAERAARLRERLGR